MGLAARSPPPPSLPRRPLSLKSSVLDWDALVAPGSALLQEVLADESRGDDLLVQLAAGLRGGGALATAAPPLRLAALALFERHCAALCRGAATGRVRMVYEMLRDHLGCPARDGPEAAAQLHDAAVRSLTQVLVALQAPRRDPRLLKFHVEALFRMLDGTVASTDAAAAGAAGGAARRQRVAVECLRALEAAFPTMLYAEAGALLQLAARECAAPTRALVVTQLALDALSSAAALHLRQAAAAAAAEREAAAAAAARAEYSPSDDSGEDEDEDSGAEEVLLRVAEGLCGGGGGQGGSASVDTPNCALEPPFLSARTDADEEVSSCSRGPPSARDSTGSTTPAPAPAAAAAAAAAADGPGRTWSADLRRSALTSALRTSSSAVDAGLEGDWTGASTPRDPVAEAPLLSAPTQATALRRFRVPPHLASGEPADAPRLLLTPEAQAQLAHAVRTFMLGVRRLPPPAAAALVAALPPVLRAARVPPAQLWPHAERLLTAGSAPLLCAVLGLHAAVPELFEGRGPALLEKVLAQACDPALPPDHRAAAVAWVLRQHAEQRHAGGALLLADCWERLLPAPREPARLFTLKARALAACLAAGVGDEGAVCRAVCAWEGAPGARAGEAQHLRALTYALRLLHGGADAPCRPALHRLHACLVASALEMAVRRPATAPAVEALVDTSPPAFASSLLRAFDALLSSVDGQFEALRERPDDAPEALDLAQRVRAAVLSRSSSLSGLMRGLSFQLSFTNRARSLAPARPAPAAGPAPTNERTRRAVDVRALRSCVAAALNSGGGGAHSTGPPSTAGDRHPGDDDDGGGGAAAPPPPAAPAVPHDLRDLEAAEAWLGAGATWEALAPGLLRHDLMAFRGLVQRAVRDPGVYPRGALQTLANYAWQYKEAHPSHALSAPRTAAALLALCHAAALAHLPWAAGGGARGGGWGLRQAELADAVQAVLDALEDGFPAPSQARARSQTLGALLADEAAWERGGAAALLGQLVCGYVDAAVEG